MKKFCAGFMQHKYNILIKILKVAESINEKLAVNTGLKKKQVDSLPNQPVFTINYKLIILPVS